MEVLNEGVDIPVSTLKNHSPEILVNMWINVSKTKDHIEVVLEPKMIDIYKTAKGFKDQGGIPWMFDLIVKTLDKDHQDTIGKYKGINIKKIKELDTRRKVAKYTKQVYRLIETFMVQL